ncbi:hypothetical protein BJD99_20470 [Rhodococcus sp. 1163]|uniref:hypothetical protein n=1 Tax=unclassified Rhodococcus (in: high G+C Gram-positive bacteria) TaxID=192944 RepID=UPI000A0755D9|nr:hypothetical protein [Rhodococcus sp. 1163]ORI19053.1 hypothetical protein BJD99_20470 [Rhodococcus sp. 1163]
MFKKSLIAAAFLAGTAFIGTGVASADPATSFGNGTWAVGTDIVPGTYVSDGASDEYGCYWERASSFEGDFDSIIANDFISPDSGQAVVTIKASDVAFNSEDCGTWTLKAVPAPAPKPAPAPAPAPVPLPWTGSAGF